MNNDLRVPTRLLVRDWLLFEGRTGIFSRGLLEKQPVPEQPIPVLQPDSLRVLVCN